MSMHRNQWKCLGRAPPRGGVVTPSADPEVPETQFVSPGRVVGIRQSMGWERVCDTAESGIYLGAEG